MKKIIRKNFMIALCYYAVAIISCEEKICTPLKNEKFQYTFVSAENLEFTFESDSNAGTAFEKKPLVLDTVDRLRYGIRFRFNYGTAANHKKTLAPNSMNVANAKDVRCFTNDYFTSIDTIKSFSIITLENFDSIFPKGSDMSKAKKEGC